MIRNKQRFHLLLDNDGFAAEQPITISDDLSNVAFRIENRAHRPHATHMRISGMPVRELCHFRQRKPGCDVLRLGPGADRTVPLPTGEDAAVTIARREGAAHTLSNRCGGGLLGRRRPQEDGRFHESRKLRRVLEKAIAYLREHRIEPNSIADKWRSAVDVPDPYGGQMCCTMAVFSDGFDTLGTSENLPKRTSPL